MAMTKAKPGIAAGKSCWKWGVGVKGVCVRNCKISDVCEVMDIESHATFNMNIHTWVPHDMMYTGTCTTHEQRTDF